MIGRIPAALMARIGWTTAAHGLVQFLRLLTNIVLARLLAPSLLGFMLIVNAIRTGVELLSDVGINQNIVSNEKGDTPDFYDTAWTLQVLRGILLGGICFFAAGALAEFFEQPYLTSVLPVIALIFLFTGFTSTSRALLQKRMNVARLSIFEVGVALVSLVAHVALAIITPTIWALVLGSVISSAAAMVASFLLVPGLRHRLIIDRASAHQLIVFGKWILISSTIYFLAMNFDRLYFAKQISLADLGIYGIARALADMVSNLAVRYGNLLLFPLVAAMRAPAPEVRQRLLRGRRTLLIAAAVGLACFVAISDLIVDLLYDERYQAAATILPLLLLGLWFAVLSTVNDSILLGMGRPAYPAFANGAKLLTYIVGVPLAFQFYGFTAAILVLSAGEVVKYLVLWMFSRGQHLGFGRDDLVLTFIFLIAIVIVRQTLSAIGLTGDLHALFPALLPASWAL